MKKIFIISVICVVCLKFVNITNATYYTMGSQVVEIVGTNQVKTATNSDGVITISDGDKDYGTMSLYVIGTSVIIDDKLYYGVAVDAMSNARGTVSGYNRFASKNMTISAKIQTASSNTTGFDGLNEAEYTHLFNRNYSNIYMNYETNEPQSVLNKIKDNNGLTVIPNEDTPNTTNTTTASYYYEFEGYSSNRSYPNCGEYHQIALFFFEANDINLYGINIEVTYSLTIFRDRTALPNKERTGTVCATVTL